MRSKKREFSGEHAFTASLHTRERDYWLNKMSGELEKSNFPHNHITKDTGMNDPRMNTVKFRIQGELFSTLMKLSNGSDIKLHMILSAGLIALLNRYMGKEDIIVGTSIYKPEIEGDFINTILPLRSRVKNDMSFKELLVQTRQTIIEAADNVNYPVEKLMFQLNIPFSKDDFKLFDIVVLLENIQDKKHIAHIRFNMIFSFLGTGEQLAGTVEYNSRMYDKETVERVSHHFVRLLHSALIDVNLPLSRIGILTEQERKRLLYDFNGTEAVYPRDKTIHGLFEEQAGRTPDRIAVVDPAAQLTYRQLNDKSDQAAILLKRKGIQPDTIVGIIMERSPEMIIGILGTLKAGGAYLPIDPDYPRERIDFMLKDSGAKVLLSEVSELSEVSGVTRPTHLTHPTHLCYVIYTSGTTGSPKGVAVHHRGVVNYLAWAEKVYLQGRKYDFPLYTSLTFDLTVTSLYLPLISGNKVVIYKDEGSKNEVLLSIVTAGDGVQILKLTPTHLKLVKYLDTGKSGIKKLIVGGEALTVELAREIYGKFNNDIEIYNEYGPTETVVGCMIYKFNPEKDCGQTVPIGIPVNNTQIYVLDGNREPVPPGVAGEIYISGDGVARGYLNRPRLTNEFFGVNPFWEGKRLYRSGDLARWLPDGNLECLGRIDHQVKLRGYRIEPGEIETRLRAHKEIKDAVVITKGSSEHLCAYIVADTELEESQLREYLALSLPDYMIPSYFVGMETLPLTANGKLDRNRLPEVEVKSTIKYIAPRDETEEKLVATWSEILGIEKDIIGIDANFFEIGGHSLKAAILRAKIHREFDVKILLEKIFKTPTIRELSRYIKETAAERYTSIDPGEEKEYYPLSLQQNRSFILQQMDLQSTAYNIPNAYILAGNLDGKKLEGTFKKLIRRHESLRTSFQIINKEPVQRIGDEVEFEIEYYDRELATVSNFIRPFDLSRVPLLRVGLAETGENKSLLLMDMHHIITDGISVGIMAKEFMALYSGEELPPLRLQYKEYSQWQDSERQKEAIKQQREFWLGWFSGEVPVLRLPTDFPRPEIQDFAGNEIGFEIGEEETAALKKLAVEEGVTLFMVLLAAYNVLLSKLSTQEDIVVGTAAASRGHEDLKNIIGLFFNTLPVRNYPSGQKKFNDFLQDVKKRTLEVFDNQDYPYDHLVRELTERKLLKRDASRNPLFDTMFGLQNFEAQAEEIPEVEIPGLKLNIYNFENKTAKFDLFFIAKEVGEIIFVTLEYASALFKRSTVEKIIDLYIDVIRQVTENRHILLKEIKILTEFQAVKSRFKTEEYQNFGF